MASKSIVDPKRLALTTRERFRRQMHFQSIDRGIHWEFGYLGETLERWHKEGLSNEIVPGEGAGSVEAYFGVDPVRHLPIGIGLQPGFPYEYEVLEKKADSEVRKYADGHIQEEKTSGIRTIPHYIKFPIANRDDWKRYKERLDPASPERRLDWKKIGRELLRCDLPVGIGLGSFFGIPRNWIGFENIAMMCYDDRDLVEEIVETLTQLYLSQLEQALRECQVDFALGWEDICFRNGPMISPQMFREIVGPRLKRVCDLLRRHGCDVILTDCDGDIRQLIPVWLECGVNCMFPIEIGNWADPVRFRKQYGRDLLMMGGFSKHILAESKGAIDAEVARLTPLVEDGGYIPFCDHRVPPNVPYENYLHYCRTVRRVWGRNVDLPPMLAGEG